VRVSWKERNRRCEKGQRSKKYRLPEDSKPETVDVLRCHDDANSPLKGAFAPKALRIFHARRSHEQSQRTDTSSCVRREFSQVAVNDEDWALRIFYSSLNISTFASNLPDDELRKPISIEMLRCWWISLAASTLMALEEAVIPTSSVKVTELCEPTGDIMYKYIYIVLMLWSRTRGRWMFRRLWEVLSKNKAELVVSSSVVDGNDDGFHRVKPQR